MSSTQTHSCSRDASFGRPVWLEAKHCNKSHSHSRSSSLPVGAARLMLPARETDHSWRDRAGEAEERELSAGCVNMAEENTRP